ncbi:MULTISPECIES: aldo/keto reductase [Rhizobium/Agrobacterium group]|uniref:aldo/keto reductase n=1 Tax=Rhizobium/Agrobacterium group TaxID=227290 RepID=UPI000B05E9AF|nr:MULTISPECIES: aldo/keto reductase [Rhizobium/Agrobacterium group]
MKRVTLPDAEVVPSMGQGTWKMGERAERRSDEIAALRAGVELDLTLIDTAEMYGDGAAETLICEAVGSLRDQLFLVSKAYPQNASRSRLAGACEASLKRLGTDRLEREDTQPWPRHKTKPLNKKAWMRRQSPPGGANRV